MTYFGDAGCIRHDSRLDHDLFRGGHGTALIRHRSIPLQSAYCAGKHAIQGFTESIRSELIHQRSRIRVSVVNMPALNTTQFTWTKNKMDHKVRPRGMIFRPEVAADAILFGVEHDRRAIMVGYTTVEATLGEKVIPGLLDRHLATAAWEGALLPEPADPNQPDNFWTPVAADLGAHGHFDAMAWTWSLRLWISKHRAVVGRALADRRWPARLRRDQNIFSTCGRCSMNVRDARPSMPVVVACGAARAAGLVITQSGCG
jgi:hypothetical protein